MNPIRVKIFSGDPAEVEKQVNAFIQNNDQITILDKQQSQSANTHAHDNTLGNFISKTVVTISIWYRYPTSPK